MEDLIYLSWEKLYSVDTEELEEIAKRHGLVKDPLVDYTVWIKQVRNVTDEYIFYKESFSQQERKTYETLNDNDYVKIKNLLLKKNNNDLLNVGIPGKMFKIDGCVYVDGFVRYHDIYIFDNFYDRYIGTYEQMVNYLKGTTYVSQNKLIEKCMEKIIDMKTKENLINQLKHQTLEIRKKNINKHPEYKVKYAIDDWLKNSADEIDTSFSLIFDLDELHEEYFQKIGITKEEMINKLDLYLEDYSSLLADFEFDFENNEITITFYEACLDLGYHDEKDSDLNVSDFVKYIKLLGYEDEEIIDFRNSYFDMNDFINKNYQNFKEECELGPDTLLMRNILIDKYCADKVKNSVYKEEDYDM